MEKIKENYSENLNLVYTQKVKVRSQMIYTGVLLAIVISFISLPFITIQVSVQGIGLIQSMEEKFELQAPVSGRVDLKFLKDNHTYHKGDTLLVIDATVPKKQDESVNARLVELTQLKNDAKKLISNLASSDLLTSSKLSTQRYLTEWQQYSTQFQTLQSKYHQTEDSYKRYQILLNQKVVSISEFEKYAYDYQNASLDKRSLISKYKNQWQIEINQFEVEEREQQNKQSELKEQQKLYVVKAPIDGTSSQLNSTQTGAYVFSGQKLAELSPDTLLIAMCTVKPSDIGLINRGQKVRIQIDAFNYNQWGFLEAEVLDISNDIVKADGQLPVFKVKCQLAKNFLTLKNGYQGNIKKGMTFAARFTVAKRSIYQLLYDKIDDWLNPGVKST